MKHYALRRRYAASKVTRPSWAQRVPIAEAATTGPDGVVYVAKQYPEGAGNYGGAVDLTEYFRRVNNPGVGTGGELVAIAWDTVPKPAYRRLRAQLRTSRALHKGRVRGA